MLTKAVAIIIDSIAIHGEADDEEQQQNDSDDWQDCRVGGRQEVVVHYGIDHNVIVAVAIRSKDSVVAGRLSAAKRSRKRCIVVVSVAPEINFFVIIIAKLFTISKSYQIHPMTPKQSTFSANKSQLNKLHESRTSLTIGA